ncbi:MAG: maleylpyruvate isomerase family mycothiol-dependent enzyme [Propionibacteriaceae bacterium]
MEYRNPIPSVDVATVRAHKREATTRFLGRTITISDHDWQQPSALPGWTRAHIATHVARNADALRQRLAHPTAGSLYPHSKALDIERGSERTALELQIDLDTSASLLNKAFDDLDGHGWGSLSTLDENVTCPVQLFPLARLAEIELHHCDLDLDYTIDDIDDDSQWWIIAWYAIRHELRGDLPLFTLVDDRGCSTRIGDGSAGTVTGMRRDLLAWITARGTGTVIGGHDAIVPLI